MARNFTGNLHTSCEIFLLIFRDNSKHTNNNGHCNYYFVHDRIIIEIEKDIILWRICTGVQWGQDVGKKMHKMS
jgi:hypothetical protein